MTLSAGGQSGGGAAVEDARPAVSGKAAVLVIHGMGQQDPYETMDSFARGLVTHFTTGPPASPLPPAIEPFLVNHGDWNETALRLTLQGGATPRGHPVIDLYEYYWAPYTEGKISYLETLRWLRKTALTPLRYLASAHELFPPEKARAAFAREILRIVFLSLPALLLTILLGYLLAKADRIVPVASSLSDLWRQSGLVRQAGLVVLAVTSALSLVTGHSYLRLVGEDRLFRREGLRGRSEGAQRAWRSYALWTCAVSVLLSLALAWSLFPLLAECAGRVARLHLLGILAVMAASEFLRRILVSYVGDVALYVNADAKAASYEVRTKILAGAREAILRLLRSPEHYGRIVLVGHSLGSVIAYDLINRLLDEVRAVHATGPSGGKLSGVELQKLRGLATFGSPLDKVHYFFRAQVPPAQPIRAQILSFMHGFRRAPSNRGYGIYGFLPYTIPDPSPDFAWINLWALADPVSGHLDFYRVAGGPALRTTANQFELPYPMRQWGRAHVRYWRDPEVYALIARHLL